MIAAIDLGGTRTKFGLVESGRVRAASVCRAEARGSLEAHLNDVLEQLDALSVRSGSSLERCDGLGLLCTGIVDRRELRVRSTNQKYDDAVDFDFAAWAERRAGLSVRMENDARGALLGEWRHGAGSGVDDLLMVTIGTGIGFAALAGGRLLRGANHAGAILGGHIVVQSEGRPCTCGGRGCLESEASGWVLPQLIREHAGFADSPLRHCEPLGFKELMAHAGTDPCAGDVWEHCLLKWGEALVSWIHLFDPERIIIGGGIMHQPDRILPCFRRILSERCWPGAGKVDLVAAQYPHHAGLLGAAALFDPPSPESH